MFLLTGVGALNPTTNNSEQSFQLAKLMIPGGVNSPVRAFKAVGGQPRFIDHGLGAYIYDADNNQLCDYVGSWGAMILGHAHEYVTKSLQEQITKGLSFGAPTIAETKLCEKIAKHVPSMQKIRLVCSGTEACMTAIRIARGHTKRPKIIKFRGHYHGHSDSLLAQSGSGHLTLALPDSRGVPPELVAHTIVVDWQDLTQVKEAFFQNKGQIAGVIFEAYCGNSGFIKTSHQFLQELQSLCQENGSLTICDEVMTGFRVAMGGVQSLANLDPDLTTLGKVIGGGLPVAAVGGKEHIMNQLAPLGDVYQAGTLSGNPLGVTCGLANLEILESTKPHAQLHERSAKLVKGLVEAASTYGLPLTGSYQGGMFGIFFTDKLPQTLQEIKDSRIHLFNQFFHGMLENGQMLPPSAYEAAFLSTAHLDQDIETTVECAKRVFEQMSKNSI